jgi:hypothetical protein
VDCDFERDFTLRGGTFLTLGGSFGMSPSLPKNHDTDAVVVAWCGVEAVQGCFFNVADGDGEVLLSYRLPRSLSNASFVVSSPSMERGGEYSMFLSDTVSGGTAMGCGLYMSAVAQAAGDVVRWQQGGLLAIIDGKICNENAYIGRTYMDAPGIDGNIFINTFEELMSGDIVKIKITGSFEYDLIGEII